MAVQINVAANQAALTASIQAGVQAYNQRFAQNNQLNLTVNQRAFSQPLGRMTGDVKDFEAALAASNARVIAFGASTAVLGGVIRSFKELASVTIDVEKNLADINRVFGLSTSQLQKFSSELFNVGKQTASTFDDASKAALEFSRQGLKAEEVLTRTKDALTLTRLAGIGTANAVDALTSTVNGFAATGVTTTQILNKLVAVEQDYAVGAGDLAEALSRTGQAAQEAGVSLDQLNALVTAAQQSTARGGAVIGNALKTIFTRLQRTETLDQLEAFNIAVRDVQGNILPAVTILQNFAGAYRGLADAQRAQLSEQVAGVYQVNILKAIVNDLNKSQGTYAGALQRGAAATNEAEVATAKLNQTLDALLKQTATSTQQLANNIGKVTFEPLAKYGTEQLKSFVESMNEILEGEGVGSTFANGLLKGIRNVIAGPGAIAAFFTLFKLIQNSFTYLSQALPQIAGITTETQNRKNIEQSILQIMQQQGPASQALAGLMGNQAAQAQLLLQIARQQTAEYQMQSTLAKQLAVQLAGQGVRVKGSGGLQVTRAGGYIPASTKMAEVVGAKAGGYSPGRVVSSPVGGVMNTAEDVKYIPGFAQPFINPPAGSKAGRAHRQNAISRTGVDPYMANGFIPNFAQEKFITEKLNVKDGDTISAYPVEPLSRDYRLANVDTPEYGQFGYEEAKKLLEYRYSGDKGVNLLNSNIVKGSKAAFYRGVFNDQAISKLLVQRGLAVPDFRYTRDNELISLANNAMAEKIGIFKYRNHPKVIQFKVQQDLMRKNIKEKDFKRTSKLGETVLRRKADEDMLRIKSNQPFKGYSQGFIPNFATPMSTASIPWFKKYSSKYKNAAGDTDLFKMGDFPTYGRGLDHEYAKNGNSAMLSYLHEDFVKSALNIALGSKKVIRPAEVGFKNKPVSDIANENDFDLLYRIADGSYSMLELKQDFKNVSGSVTGFMNKKLANLEKENPALAKKVSSMIAVSNRPKFTDPTGRNAGANFSEFEMAAASIVKDKYSNVDPSISAKLTKVTDGLLRRYEAKKNTTYDGFIPNFASGTDIYKGYAFNNTGKIYNDLYHSDAWDSIEGSTAGAIKYAYHNNKLLLQTNKAISPILKKAFLSRGVPESAFSPVEDVDSMMRSKNKQEINDKLKNLGSVQLSSGIQAILEKGYYRKLIKGQQSYNIPGGVSPEELKIFGGADGWVKWQEQNYGPLKWDSHASGFIPNFANQDFEILREIIRLNKSGAISNNRYTSSEEDDKNNITRLYRGVKGISERWNSIDKNNPQAINKAIFEKQSGNKIMNEKEFVNKSFSNLAFSHRLNWPDETENPIPFLSTSKKEDVADMFAGPSGLKGSIAIKNSRLLGNERRYENLYKKYGKEKVKGILYKLSKTGGGKGLGLDFVDAYNSGNAYKGYGNEGEIGLFSRGFIPNLANFIDVDSLGKNSVNYSGDLMQLIKDIEASIGRNLSSGELRFLAHPKTNLSKLNDPEVLKDFINSERKGGFAGYANGFIPNFAYKQSVMGLEESMSGNKAIFDTKPFPHIRNSGQPTFSSAIADHGGLGNALSDSMRGQKAAGLMNKGYIPNFAKQPNNGSFDIVRFSNSIATSVDNFSKQLSNKIINVKDNILLALDDMNNNFDPQKIQRTAESTAKKIISSISGAGNEFVEKISSPGIDAINNVRNKFTRQNASQSNGGASSQRLTAAQMAASFSNLPTRNEGLEKFAQSLSKASTAISIAGPMLAGFAEQAIYGDRKRTDMTSGERAGQSLLSTGLSSITTGAGIGANFGPLGAGVGAAIGALVGLTSALNATTLSAEELAQLNQEQIQKSQASISAASSYIEAQKSLTQMIASGASSSDIEIATKKLSDNFNEIKDVKLQEIFNSTGGDIVAMTKQLQDYTNQVTKESARQTGLYGANLKPEERASALSLGLGQEKTSEFITNAKLALKQADEELSKNPNMLSFSPLSFLSKYGKEKVKTPVLKNFAESQIPQNEPERESKVKSLIQNILNGNFEEVVKILEKNNIVSETNKAAVNFKQAATRSFNQIFLDMEQSIAKSAFDVALSFEKDSGSRKIQSTILDFSMNFQDSINSFLSNNLPDARKFDFTAATASQKAEMLLQKSQQDYNKAIAEQDNERSIFLNKSSENLTKEFKSSFLPSQAAAEFYQSNVLPQIQQGAFAGNATSLAQQFEKASFQKAESKFSEAGMAGGLNKNDIASELNRVTKVMEALADAGLTNEDQYKKLQEAQKALIDLQNQTALFQNKNEITKLQGVIDTAAREREIFETKQANAKKELEINKQLSEAKIAVEKDIAIEKAKVDKVNLARMESMKNLSATIGNRLDISKAESGSRVAAFQRQLNDPTQTYGMGTAQITERRIKLQSDILKEQRTAEDQAINAEIQQRMLEMAAEQENTAATLKLNDTIMALIETQLKGALGGQQRIEEISATAKRMGAFAPANIDKKYGAGTYAQYQALQRIEESRTASAANNPVYNSKTFEDAMAKAGFNNVGGKGMSELEQRNFLSAEQLKAEQAGNVVLANTIRRYREQIDAKQQVLNITRKQIDADIQLQATTDRQLSTIRGRIAKGFGELNDEGDKLVLNLGENLPRMFADGMVNGIKAAIKESDNLGDALMGVAANFLDSVSTTLMQAGTYKILGGLGFDSLLATKQTGGLIRAQSGMYISGSGSGDKYPALLENGEYVLNRNAVMAMGGPAALDTLNFSAAPRFAAGGQFKNQLDSISSMEANMTEMGLESSPLYKEITDAAKQKAEEDRRKKLADKQQRAAMIGSLVAAAATVAIGAGISNIASNSQAAKAQSLSAKVTKTGGAGMTNSELGQLTKFQKSGLLGNNFEYKGPTNIQTGFKSLFSAPTQGSTWYQKFGNTASKPFKRQTGGLIGSRLSDTIPGYMEGGLYNSPMVKRYGTGMQVGGSSLMAAGNNSSTVNNNTSANNSFNFNTTVQRDGTIKMGSNATSYEQQDIELSKNLNNRIYAAVGEVIRKEKQFGGSLAGVRNS